MANEALDNVRQRKTRQQHLPGKGEELDKGKGQGEGQRQGKGNGKVFSKTRQQPQDKTRQDNIRKDKTKQN